jgi:hypothetical protein
MLLSLRRRTFQPRKPRRNVASPLDPAGVCARRGSRGTRVPEAPRELAGPRHGRRGGFEPPGGVREASTQMFRKPGNPAHWKRVPGSSGPRARRAGLRGQGTFRKRQRIEGSGARAAPAYRPQQQGPPLGVGAGARAVLRPRDRRSARRPHAFANSARTGFRRIGDPLRATVGARRLPARWPGERAPLEGELCQTSR